MSRADFGENSVRIQEFVAHGTQVNCLAFGPKSNQVLATGGEDSKVRWFWYKHFPPYILFSSILCRLIYGEFRT